MTKYKALILNSNGEIAQPQDSDLVVGGSGTTGINAKQTTSNFMTNITTLNFDSNFSITSVKDKASVTLNLTNGFGAEFFTYPNLDTGSSQNQISISPYYLELPDNTQIKNLSTSIIDKSSIYDFEHEEIIASSGQTVFNFPNMDFSNEDEIWIKKEANSGKSSELFMYLPNCSGVDWSNNHYLIASTNGVSFDSTNKITDNFAASFTGNSSYIRWLTSTTLTDLGKYTQPFTFDFWFKITGSSGTDYHMIWDNRASSGTQSGITIWLQRSTGILNVQLQKDTGTSDKIVVKTQNNAWSDNNWYHCIVSYNGGGNASDVNIFLNGVKQILTASIDNLSGDFTASGNYHYLGTWALGITSHEFKGYIDEFVIWNKELSYDEIFTRYNNGSGNTVEITYSDFLGNKFLTHFDNNLTEENGNYTLTQNGTLSFSNTVKKIGTHSINFPGGSANYLDCDYSLPFHIYNPFSLRMWVYLDSSTSGSYYWLFSNTNSTVTGIDTYINKSNLNINFALYNNSASSKYAFISTNTNSITLDTWHQIVFTYDGKGSAKGMKIYLDGSELTTTINSDTLIGLDFYVNQTANLGKRRYTTSFDYKGYFDEVTISNFKLSATEISNSYNSGSGQIEDKVYDFTSSSQITLQKGLKENDKLIAAYKTINDKWYYMYVTNNNNFPNFAFISPYKPNFFGERSSFNGKYIGSFYNDSSNHIRRFKKSSNHYSYLENKEALEFINTSTIGTTFHYRNAKKWIPPTAKALILHHYAKGTGNRTFSNFSAENVEINADKILPEHIQNVDPHRSIGLTSTANTEQISYAFGYIEDVENPRVREY